MTLCYKATNVCLHGYVDSDFAGDVDSWKSTIGYVFTLGSGAVSQVSRLQKIVALSTTEAEYVVAIENCKEMILLKDFMKELGKEQMCPSLHSDSQSAIYLANNSAYHDRTKHIDVWYHFIHILLKKIHTSQNSTDMLTKMVTWRS